MHFIYFCRPRRPRTWFTAVLNTTWLVSVNCALRRGEHLQFPFDLLELPAILKSVFCVYELSHSTFVRYLEVNVVEW